MSETVEHKRMWVADVVLRRAAQFIPLQLSSAALPTDLDKIDLADARVMNLANLSRLESVGRGRDLRGGFWRDLMRACDMLGLEDRMPLLLAEYRAALQRVGASTSSSPDPDMMSVASAICQLPVLFRSTDDRSMLDLLAITGYTPGLTRLTRDALLAALRVEPALVDVWLTHSVDKRTPSGWYFSSEQGASVVAFHPDGPRFAFADPIEACAEFILREVDGLAELMSHRAGAG
jgi:hypothetical protein